MLGKGIVGGMINDPAQQGRQLAEMAIQVIDGASPNEIGVLPSSDFSPQFDFNVLNRFGLKIDALPEGSRVINHTPSLFAQHKPIIISSLMLISFLIAVITILSRNIQRRIQAEKYLTSLKLSLEDKVREQTEALRNRNSKLEQLSRSMATLAHTDSLTGLPNRRAGSDLLDEMLAAASADNRHFSVALCDVDEFKKINDVHGHDVGDDVLVEIARVMKATLRPQDVLCRWEGRSF